MATWGEQSGEPEPIKGYHWVRREAEGPLEPAQYLGHGLWSYIGVQGVSHHPPMIVMVDMPLPPLRAEHVPGSPWAREVA